MYSPAKNNVCCTVEAIYSRSSADTRYKKFKQLLYGTEEQQKSAKIFPECFVVDDFVVDSKNGMKITDYVQIQFNLVSNTRITKTTRVEQDYYIESKK